MNALFDSAVCPQLVLTLGHFVWQGLAVGGLAWLAGLALRRCSSSARYRLYLVALLVMAACPVATFLWLNHEPTVEAAAERLPLVGIKPAESFPRPASAAAEELVVAVDEATPIAATASEHRFDLSLAPAPSEASRTDWRRFAPLLTAVYLAGVLAMLVRLVLGLRGGRQLRRRSEPVADRELLELLTGRAAALGLRSVPVLAWCREIAVPTVVGVLRPTILLPMSLTTGITPDQLAAILTHELAHIRRWDPLVNVFQRVVEAVLFFHPLVWFVSRRIRRERENCCDDLVLATGTDPVGYASSLLDVAERAAAERGQTLTALAALRADGRTSELGGRIHRLVGAERHEAIRLNRPGLALMLAVALLALAGLSRLAVNAEEEIENEMPAEVMSEDERAAWRELEATGLPIYGDAARWQSQRRWLATLERMNYPESERSRIRGQLNEPVQSAELWRVPPQAWPLIGRLESLHDLGIVASDVGEAALRHVARLPNLRRIRLTNSNLLPTDAAVLKAATPLEQIEITFTVFDVPAARRQELLGELTEAEQAWAEEYRMRHSGREHIIEAAILTDRTLEEFRDLPHLRTLRLVNTPVSGTGVEAIGAHRALEELDVSIVDFPPDAARAISRLTRLRKFRTTADGVTDETLAAFAGLVHLEELELWAGDVTDAGVRRLAPLKSLRKLALRGSSITDTGLLELAALPQLERLDLSLAKGRLTAAGLARFQRLKPQCQVIVDADKKEIAPDAEHDAADGETTASSAVAPADEPPSRRDEFAETGRSGSGMDCGSITAACP